MTDDERREVARKLREDARRYLLEGRFCGSEIGHRIAKAIGCRYFGAGPQISDLFPRLADLIEPSEPKVRCVAEVKVDGERLEQLAHDAVAKATNIDRDALLKLAYMLQAMGERSDEKGRYDLGITFTSIADRIREALGESDG